MGPHFWSDKVVTPYGVLSWQAGARAAFERGRYRSPDDSAGRFCPQCGQPKPPLPGGLGGVDLSLGATPDRGRPSMPLRRETAVCGSRAAQGGPAAVQRGQPRGGGEDPGPPRSLNN